MSNENNYQVTCSDPNITITRDKVDKNKFHIKYPNYNKDTVVNYSLTIRDSNDEEIKVDVLKFIKTYPEPIIDSIVWNESTHIEKNSYAMTVHAHDPNHSPILYKLVSNDPSIIIAQDNEQKNVFHVTYGKYDLDTEITFTITVTNENELSSVKDETTVVHAYTAPNINGVSWDSNDQWEQHTYTMTIDATDEYGLNLTYQVTCDDANVTIEQDTNNENVFHVTYPDYITNTNVTFIVTVTNNQQLYKTMQKIITVNAYQPPAINSITWNTNIHLDQNSYVMTISATDPQGLDFSYQVTCNDANVTITQDTNNENVFNVTYPEYTENTNVTFTVTVTNTDSLSVNEDISILVYATDPPIINSITWNDDNQYEQNSYVMTIDATDPQGLNISYSVTCDDANVTIEQDTNNENVFNVTYPEYTENTNVTFTVTVTNTDSLNTVNSITSTVHAYTAPTISGITWNDDNQYEQSSYVMTISATDPQGLDFSYQVTCNDANVTITQDTNNENVFNVTYPEYASDTSVTFTVTVTNTDNLTDTTTNTKLVKHIVVNYDRGVFIGGFDGTYVIDTIDYIAISTPGDAQSFGNVTTPRYGHGACSNGSDNRGIIGGGFNNSNNMTSIEYITISTPGDTQDFGDLTVSRRYTSSASNNTSNRGVFAGGMDTTNALDTVDYVTITTPGDAQDFGNLTSGVSNLSMTSNGVNDRGITGGGNINISNSWLTTKIDYITISTPGDAQNFGNLTNSIQFLTATSNTTNERGVFGGGRSSGSTYNVIEYVTISTPGNSQDFGDLSIGKHGLSSTSNGIDNISVFGGGYNGTLNLNTIEYITITTPGDAQDFGDLTNSYRLGSATSNSI